jgi:four helix bundle protein
MKDYKKLLIWQRGMDLVEEVYRLVVLLPSEEKYGLRSQATRSAVSVVLNIAEGSAKTSKKEYKKFLEIALGSTFELETIMLVISRLKLIEGEILNELLEAILVEQRMINGFIKKIGADE